MCNIGQFGWNQIDEFHIPFIMRMIDGECLNFVSVHMAEIQLLKDYLFYLNENIFHTCVSVTSHFITKSEAKFLNRINGDFSNNMFGKYKFTAGKDIIVHLEDLHKFNAFKKFCINKLKGNNLYSPGSQDKCGFIQINDQDVVPYCVKNCEKYIPRSFFQRERLGPEVVLLENWDLVYIKFCCMVIGIKDETFLDSYFEAINFNDIKNYFPFQTQFKVCWPDILPNNLELLVNNQTHPHVIKPSAWIKVPTAIVPAFENTIPHTVKTAHDILVAMKICQNILPTNQMVFFI